MPHVWTALRITYRIIRAPFILVGAVLWSLLLMMAFSPRVWIGLGLLLLSSEAWANTANTMPIDRGVDLVIGWLTGKFAWGLGMTIIIGAAWRMYSQWGHSSGGEFYGLLFSMIIIAIILNADLIMASMGAAAELPPEVSDVLRD